MNKAAAFRAPDAWNQITQRIIACAMEVHSVLGPGLLERLYEEAMDYEMRRAGMRFERQQPVVVRYKEIELSGQRVDLLVESIVIVELKAADKVPDMYLAQLVSYMRSAQIPLGLLINFNVPHLREGIYRRLNCDCDAVVPYLRPVSPSVVSPNSAPLSSSV